MNNAEYTHITACTTPQSKPAIRWGTHSTLSHKGSNTAAFIPQKQSNRMSDCLHDGRLGPAWAKRIKYVVLTLETLFRLLFGPQSHDPEMMSHEYSQVLRWYVITTFNETQDPDQHEFLGQKLWTQIVFVTAVYSAQSLTYSNKPHSHTITFSQVEAVWSLI